MKTRTAFLLMAFLSMLGAAGCSPCDGGAVCVTSLRSSGEIAVPATEKPDMTIQYCVKDECTNIDLTFSTAGQAQCSNVECQLTVGDSGNWVLTISDIYPEEPPGEGDDVTVHVELTMTGEVVADASASIEVVPNVCDSTCNLSASWDE